MGQPSPPFSNRYGDRNIPLDPNPRNGVQASDREIRQSSKGAKQRRRFKEQQTENRTEISQSEETKRF
ncbi:hypothetical protein L9Z17_15150 [Leptospira noguchii]|nr:hypothetical protein [Leptospira noguchii]